MPRCNPPLAIRGGVLCLGNIVFDILVRPVDAIRWNTSTWVESIEQHMGGNGANTAYALAVLGVPVRLMAYAGRDAFGEQLLRKLEQRGVDLTGVVRSESMPTPATVGLVNESGDRFLLHRPGASRVAFEQPLQFTPELVAGMSHFHLANAFALPALRTQAAGVVAKARQAGLTVSIDTGWDSRGRWMADLGECLPFTDILFANEDEAMRLTGAEDYRLAAGRLREFGATVVVLKRGPKGCSVFASEASELRAPAFKIDAVDTTGAGDCFAGGFLAALRRGCPYEKAARFANAVAALSVQHLGATDGLVSFEETEAWMETAPVRDAHDQT